jgi:hypothetical protein
MPENILIDKNQEAIETWAYIEIMGHSRITGRGSTMKLGVNVMLQVDVPKAGDGFLHTELYAQAAIFSIKPTTEEWCHSWIASNISYEVLPYISPTRQLNQPDLFDPRKGELNDTEEDFKEVDDE